MSVVYGSIGGIRINAAEGEDNFHGLSPPIPKLLCQCQERRRDGLASCWDGHVEFVISQKHRDECPEEDGYI
jgi:hypothetical protein